ncbi:unnamed protein product [Microthlaspi erraticum]|nr:unnamed protein product [Microthlaspi erraticum]
MSSGNGDYASRQWMYARIDSTSNQLSDAFIEGLKEFIDFAKNHVMFVQKKKMFCPCTKCENRKFLSDDTVAGHLYNRGFMPSYFVWVAHGEHYNIDNQPRQTQENTSMPNDVPMPVPNPYTEMVTDAFGEGMSSNPNMEEEPNEEAKRFFNLLRASQNALYDGCREELSQLSLASRCMALKTDYNLSEKCMDSISKMMRDYMPENSNATASYYETKKLMRSLGLPYMKIDVC